MDEDKEPYATLFKSRFCPGLGAVFGVYFNCEILKTCSEYTAALPAKLGYKNFKSVLKHNPISVYSSGTYVKIHKDDHLLLRYEEEPKWKSFIKKNQ